MQAGLPTLRVSRTTRYHRPAVNMNTIPNPTLNTRSPESEYFDSLNLIRKLFLIRNANIIRHLFNSKRTNRQFSGINRHAALYYLSGANCALQYFFISVVLIHCYRNSNDVEIKIHGNRVLFGSGLDPAAYIQS